MKQYQYLLFDLDGTLTDSAEGITNSAAYALQKFGISVADKTTLYPFIGPPLVDSFQKYYGFSPEKAELATEYYREYFRDRGILENRLYDGIPQALEALKSKGKALILATSKPEPFAKRILEHFGLSEYFTLIVGASFDHSRAEKWDVIEYALNAMQITDRQKAVMIGDRKHDIIGAKKTGLDSIGVLWGFGDREELSEAGADYILEQVGDLLLLAE